MIKLLTLLSARDDLQGEDFNQLWSGSHAEAARTLLGPHARRHAQLRLRPGRVRLDTPPVSARVDGMEETWFDDLAAFERFWASPEAALLQQSHRSFVGAATAYFFEEWDVWRRMMPFDLGDDKLKSIGLQTRKPEHSHAEFMTHWAVTHAEVVMNSGGGAGRRRYAQLHLSPAPQPPGVPAMEVEINGIAELWYDSEAAMRQGAADAAAKAIVRDGDIFMGAYTSFFFTEEEILPRDQWAPY